MKLLLTRKIFNKNNTIGELYVDEKFECNTLEDTDRFLESGGEKVENETAIPRGVYQVTIDVSQRFKRKMPHILNVPKFTGIRIHSGNTEANTSGCILVGEYVTEDFKLANSKKAFDRLFKKLEEALQKNEKIEIEII